MAQPRYAGIDRPVLYIVGIVLLVVAALNVTRPGGLTAWPIWAFVGLGLIAVSMRPDPVKEPVEVEARRRR